LIFLIFWIFLINIDSKEENHWFQKVFLSKRVWLFTCYF
jgi:hypothetical protein